MADFTSYEALLKKWLVKVDAKKIFEWGPGFSTIMMADKADAQITTVEHDFGFYGKNAVRLKECKNVTLCWAKTIPEYIDFPKRLGCKFDLIFVDGLCDTRVSCLKVAKDLLTEKGVVILHDSERAKYNPGRVGYRTVEEDKGTAVLKP